MEYSKTLNNDMCEIAIKGKFTFADHREFRFIFSAMSDDSINHVMIDLNEVEFVDSAALGILLLARDESEKTGKELTLRNPVGQVKKMFKLSRFYDLFNIVEEVA